ncbi:GNAT family N-acetyltransferase [Luteimonas sp. MC1825]|uniref:GNAT family N-acetyltransferase n=1 Tax=Luteimonas sp. MC1825 TaxID=2761107 RepID=UPI00161313E3|nr:GNAT family N-acetyltransferase [Luteimonas sp. MC1825]MBB6599045.1 GNAT family N-acetyltransferase [Luteimonas sp. MC1825]QOC89178.1 GNAT family N-acetyltransferase [Luteimonas sp. MC1825]
MSIATKRLQADNDNDWSALLSLGASVGFHRMQERLHSNWTKSSPLTACYGVEEDGKLLASILFIAHDIRMAGVATKAYQSCWIMVRPDRQGGPWLGLIYRKAMRDLARIDGKFIFGFPNSIAMPVFKSISAVNVLAMRRTYVALRLPRSMIDWQWDLARCHGQQSLPGLVTFEQAPILAWKQHEHPGLVSARDGGNLLWGRIEERRLFRLGSLKVLLAGGCEVEDPGNFMQLARRMGREYGIDVIRFVSPEGSVVAAASRVGRAARKTESFTYIPLVKDLPTDIAFDVCTGLKGMY